MDIKAMVAEGRKVRFQYYRLGELWYVTETGFEFPVPITDCADGKFLAEDKAILFMRLHPHTRGSTRVKGLDGIPGRATGSKTGIGSNKNPGVRL